MTLLRIEHLSKSFDGVRAVDDVSFSLEAGQLLALIGPNGAGKSTCFNMINGQLKPDTGSIRLNSQQIAGRRPRDIWRLGVGRTFQIAATFNSMTVLENVQMALLSHERRVFDAFARIASWREKEAMALLDLVGMAGHAQRSCAVLAYGDVKRAELAVALANRPKLLLMDEPTAGMAPEERNALMALTARLAKERNIGVLFTEHSMDVVFEYADTLIVLARGKLIAQGNVDAVRNDSRVREVYLGTGASFSPRAALDGGAAR
ncbi:MULTISPECIES: ABC transporter ATP-binding protein [unclassified Caballeronia]|uniref:ABC transporter ATP-binding protein n=1 Tax=unclassified Caballeronia TaxID=2646786 RepID=UPI00285C7059|nr:MULTISPECIES: ABC transporter ATP-binding protein [unclassified Caballeronia]MDR5739284.1 ABC transporter ATP-binding protein [Caballeronia sp. LZ016]MDR5807775.1 ABC transporter ATP-binding protein [Caballeronia sp. LZ019]